ncbi:MAG: Gfo/Idh/MocA family oxidoreductase [Ignavibacteriales bacterium]|nr:Gfo/Idh/MocA family oxidoreductase [Ignavibacteriales bacterium]
MKRFGLTGAAGYVAPRHLKAIKETGNELTACFDPHDSVGVLDHFFPHANYFTGYERFERYLAKLALHSETKIDFLTVCSPNHIHDSQIRLGLNIGADVICEKPLVLFPQNLDLLEELESKTGKKVYTVMQLRNHPSLISLKKEIKNSSDKKHKVELTYIASRGNWYHYSWKGDEEKSGGVATNIGIHLFDLLIWLFGGVVNSEVHLSNQNKMSGLLELQNANVVWYLSIDENDLPKEIKLQNKPTYRSIIVDDKEIEFTDGFSDLHTKVYGEILSGRGLGIIDARPSIEAVYNIRFAKVSENKNLIHPLLSKVR